MTISGTDVLPRVIADDRVIVVDGGEYDGKLGTVVDVIVLPEGIVVRVDLDDHFAVMSFADWQVEQHWAARRQHMIA